MQMPTQNPQMQQIKNLMRTVQMSANPQLALQQIINQNPNLKNILNLANSNGVNLQQLFYTMAQQKGADPQQVLRELQM